MDTESSVGLLHELLAWAGGLLMLNSYIHAKVHLFVVILKYTQSAESLFLIQNLMNIYHSFRLENRNCDILGKRYSKQWECLKVGSFSCT